MNGNIKDLYLLVEKIVIAHKFSSKLNEYGNNKDGRKSYGFVYLISGELEYKFTNGTQLKARAGDFIFLKPTDEYALICTSPCLHYTVNFLVDEESLEGDLLKSIFFSNEHLVVNLPTKNAFSDYLDEICSVWSQKNEGYQIYALSLLYRLIYLFIKENTSYFYDKNYAKVNPAKEYIDAHWNENFSINDLAEICFLSATHFRHLFERVFNISPIEYRNSLRLLYAKDYLIQNRLTITEIAYKCGFDDVNYFSRFFKKHTGLAPTSYSKI